MGIAYKLTDADGYTRRGEPGETRWIVGETVRPTGKGYDHCGPGVLHGYISPEVAVFGNPFHADIVNPRLFEVESDAPWETDGLKRWTTGACRVVRELPLPLPTVTIDALVAWAICLSPHKRTRTWAVGWLAGKDRSATSALAAETAVWNAWTARAAEAQAAAEWAACESRLMPALERARAILAGTFPASKYDEALGVGEG